MSHDNVLRVALLVVFGLWPLLDLAMASDCYGGES